MGGLVGGPTCCWLWTSLPNMSRFMLMNIKSHCLYSFLRISKFSLVRASYWMLHHLNDCVELRAARSLGDASPNEWSRHDSSSFSWLCLSPCLYAKTMQLDHFLHIFRQPYHSVYMSQVTESKRPRFDTSCRAYLVLRCLHRSFHLTPG